MTDDIEPEVREARAEMARANGAGLKRALAEETAKAMAREQVTFPERPGRSDQFMRGEIVERAPSAMTSVRAENEAWSDEVARAVDRIAGLPPGDSFREAVDHELFAIRTMLLAKNQAYGNSALDPVRCFSKASTVEQLNVRLDDKISRLMRGENAGEDVDLDLIGYLVLRRIAMRG